VQGGANSVFNVNKNNSSKNKGGAYTSVDPCGAGIIEGMIAGQCTKDSFSNGNGCGGKSDSNYGSQCTWQSSEKRTQKQAVTMKTIIHFSLYLALFIIGFTLLNNANVLDLNTHSRSELISKFIVMIIVLIATTRWGIKAYTLLTGQNKN
jgi:hypothetical protein